MNEIAQLTTNNEEINKAFRIAYSDIVANIVQCKDGEMDEPKEVIYAGMGYDMPWTRDAAINVWNCCGLLFPEVSKSTLKSVLTKDEEGITFKPNMIAGIEYAEFKNLPYRGKLLNITVNRNGEVKIYEKKGKMS